MGEAKAPASGFQPSGGKRSGAGAAPVTSEGGRRAWGLRQIQLGPIVLVLAAVLVACGSDEPVATRQASRPAPRAAAADPAAGVPTELDGVAPAYDDAVLAELTGDSVAARVEFEKLLAAADAPPPLAAHAALH